MSDQGTSETFVRMTIAEIARYPQITHAANQAIRTASFVFTA